MAVHTETVTITSPNGTFDGYLALPEGGPAPGVIVIQEIFGVNAHIQDVTRRVAEAGYAALAPDLFWSEQPGFTSGYSPEEIEVARGYKDKISLERAVQDVAAAMQTLSARPETGDGALGVTGFCWGGLMTYLAACRLQPACASSYYGGGIAGFLAEADDIACPMMFHFGEKDTGIPMEQVESIKQALGGKSGVEVHTYPEADHGFNCDLRSSYHAPSAQLAWRRTLEFLRENLAANLS